MNRMFKKTITLFVAVVILAASIPFAGFVGIGESFIPIAQAQTAELVKDYYTYEIDGNNDAIIVDCDESISGEVVIPSNLNGYTVTSIGEDAFNNCGSITSITVPNSVTFIGTGAFSNCYSLTEAVISKNVISIEDNTFSECYNLKSVSLPDNLVSIEYYAFGWCENLTSIDLPDGLKSIEYGAFEYCSSLSSAEIPASVVTIGDCAFIGCSSLTAINVADGNREYVSDECGVLFNKDKTTLLAYPCGNTRTSYEIPYGVSEIGHYAFYYAQYLTDITIPEGVITVNENAFSNCRGVKELPDSITTIGYRAFCNCDNIKNIPNNVVTIDGNAFDSCDGIENLVISESVKRIDYNAFINCSFIKTIYISGGDNQEISNSAFRTCGSLESITVDNTNENYSSDENGVLFNKDKTVLIKYPSGSTRTSYDIPESVVTIGEYSFERANNLTSIDIPDNVKEINYNAFSYSINLNEISISDNIEIVAYNSFNGTGYYNNSNNWENNVLYIDNILYDVQEYNVNFGNYEIKDSTVYISSAFCGNETLTGITIPASVKTIGNSAFTNCKNLANVTFAEGSKLQKIGNEAFGTCISLSKIEIPDGTTYIGNNAFYGCLNLKSIYLPDTIETFGYAAFYETGAYINPENWENGVLYIDNVLYEAKEDVVSGVCEVKDSTVYIGYDAFNNCDKLTGIIIPASVKIIGASAFNDCDELVNVEFAENSLLKKVDSYAFDDCYALKSVSLPSGVIEIGDYAFSSCYNLSEFELPESLKVIGDYAFYDCYRLAIDISSEVERIGSYAFLWCGSLETVNIPASVTYIGDRAFSYCHNRSINVDEANLKYSSDENGVLFNKDKSVLICYPDESSLSSYTIPAVTETIEDYAFNDAIITEICFPENGNLRKIGSRAFQDCYNLNGEIDIPDTVESIGESAFSGCDYITNVNIPSSVNIIGANAFTYTNSLTAFTVDESNANYSTDSFGVLYNKDKTVLIQYPQNSSLTEYEIPATVTEISAYAFCLANNLTKVSFAENNRLKKIGSYTFADCYSLEEITIPETVQEIGSYAFSWCSKLGAINIPESLIYLEGDVFRSCSQLKTVTIAENSRLTSIGWEAFEYCESLEEIYIPASVKYISEEVFSECSNLKKFVVDEDNRYFSVADNVLYSKDKRTVYCYPEGKTDSSYEAPYGVRTILSYAFRNNPNLVEIKLPDTITSIGYSAFYNSGYYNNESNWENGVLYIDKYLVATNSEDVPIDYEIKDGTLLLAYDTFNYCNNLEVLTIPDSILYVYSDFYNCANFTDVYYEGSPSEWQDILDRYYNYYLESKNIHYGRSNDKATVADEETDISLEYYEDIYEGEVDISVTKSLNETAFDIISSELDVSQNLLYDIKMTVDGVETQPTGKVTVRMPLPDGYDPSRTFVYHVDIENGRVEKMNAAVETINGKDYLVFDTTHFSYYAIIEKPIEDDGGDVTPPVDPPVVNVDAMIRIPSTTTINYGDSIWLHANIEGDLPAGAKIIWTPSNNNFEVVEVSADELSCKITPKSSGTTTFTVSVVDAEGKVLSTDTQDMTAKAGLWQKIVAFFKKLFGATKTYPELYKAIF